MKNPLEFTLLEVEAVLHDDPEGPQSAPNLALTQLVSYLHYRIKLMRDYEVKKVQEQIRTKETVTRRKVRTLDSELLDACEVVTLEF